MCIRESINTPEYQYTSDQQRVMSALRRRTPINTRHVDLRKTISKAIGNAGYIEGFEYAQSKRKDEESDHVLFF